MRDPSLRHPRGAPRRVRAQGDHPVGRPGFRHRGGSAARAAKGLRAGRAGARHLLWRAGDVRATGRAGRGVGPSRVRPRLHRGGGRVRALRGTVGQGRARAGVDEPRRPGRGAAAGISRRRGERGRALRRDRRRPAPLLWRAVPSRGRAHAAGRGAVAEFHPPRRGLRAATGAWPRSASRQWRACAARWARRASFAACRAASIHRSRPCCCTRRLGEAADLHLRRYRSVARRPRRKRSCGSSATITTFRSSIATLRDLFLRKLAGVTDPEEKRKDHRRDLHRRVRRGGEEDRRRRIPGAGHALSRRDRIGELLRRPVAPPSSRTTMSAACRSG